MASNPFRGSWRIIEWTCAGHDEEDEASGRGWARLEGRNKLVGHLYFHMGDDSAFEATRSRARLGRR